MKPNTRRVLLGGAIFVGVMAALAQRGGATAGGFPVVWFANRADPALDDPFGDVLDGVVASYVQPGDTILMSAGTQDGWKATPVDWGIVGRDVSLLRNRYGRDVNIVLRTAGLANVSEITKRAGFANAFDGIGYNYEPPIVGGVVTPPEYLPEFSWSMEQTIAFCSQGLTLARQAGVEFWIMPTGRGVLGILNGQPINWNYSRFPSDALLPQLQSYCADGRFAQAVTKLVGQLGLGRVWYPQVSVGGLGNAAQPLAAAACSLHAIANGATGSYVQWARDRNSILAYAGALRG